LERGISTINKNDVARFFFGIGQVLFVNAVGQRGRCRLVEQTQYVETGDGRGVQERLAFRVRKVRRNRNHAIVHLGLERYLGRLFQLGQQHAGDLFHAERVLLVEVVDTDADLVVVALNYVERQVLELLLDERVIDGTAQQPLKAVHSVLHVSDHLVFGGHTDDAVPRAEGHARRRGPQTVIVRDGLDAAGAGHGHIT